MALHKPRLAFMVTTEAEATIWWLLAVKLETARSRGKALRRKLGTGSRARAVAKALQLGLARLTG